MIESESLIVLDQKEIEERSNLIKNNEESDTKSSN